MKQTPKFILEGAEFYVVANAKTNAYEIFKMDSVAATKISTIGQSLGLGRVRASRQSVLSRI
jgi:hypothetical protein